MGVFWEDNNWGPFRLLGCDFIKERCWNGQHTQKKGKVWKGKLLHSPKHAHIEGHRIEAA